MALCITAMTKQCGTCKWWDMDYITQGEDDETYSPCNLKDIYMSEKEGQDCPVYEERKE